MVIFPSMLKIFVVSCSNYRGLSVKVISKNLVKFSILFSFASKVQPSFPFWNWYKILVRIQQEHFLNWSDVMKIILSKSVHCGLLTLLLNKDLCYGLLFKMLEDILLSTCFFRWPHGSPSLWSAFPIIFLKHFMMRETSYQPRTQVCSNNIEIVRNIVSLCSNHTKQLSSRMWDQCTSLL